ncbi:MAG: SGNH/GDSL hydrolase family protein [Synoicihabitans sp.]
MALFSMVLAPFADAETGVDLPGKASATVKDIHPAYAPVIDDPALPRVLLIGDSISIGYTAPAREALRGKVNLHRIPENGGDTQRGLDNLSAWLAPENGTWDLIHFNWGLWDLCYRNPAAQTQGNRDKIHGTLTHTPDAYAANLDKLVRQLQQTGATLIFATTTPVPEGEIGRKIGDDIIYNQAAREVMEHHGIPINDLHATMAGKMAKFARAPGDVHFTPEGSELLGSAVAEAIKDALADSR